MIRFALIFTSAASLCCCEPSSVGSKNKILQEDERQSVRYRVSDNYLWQLEVKHFKQEKSRDPFVFHPDEMIVVAGPGNPWLVLEKLGWKLNEENPRSYLQAKAELVLEADSDTHQRLLAFHRSLGIQLNRLEGSREYAEPN